MITERIKKIGLKVKLERVKRGLSREKLAEMADLHTGTIGTIERGEKEPSITTLEQIAAALNIEFEDLINVSNVEL